MDGNLIIVNIIVDDFGMYMCEVVNVIGSVWVMI